MSSVLRWVFVNLVIVKIVWVWFRILTPYPVASVIEMSMVNRSGLELLKETPQIVKMICSNNGEVGRASCIVGGPKDSLKGFLQVCVREGARRPAWPWIEDEVVDSFDLIVLDINATAILTLVICRPTNLPVQDV